MGKINMSYSDLGFWFWYVQKHMGSPWKLWRNPHWSLICTQNIHHTWTCWLGTWYSMCIIRIQVQFKNIFSHLMSSQVTCTRGSLFTRLYWTVINGTCTVEAGELWGVLICAQVPPTGVNSMFWKELTPSSKLRSVTRPVVRPECEPRGLGES